MLLFVTPLNVPVLVPPATAAVTTPPLVVRLFPAASFACTVTVTEDSETTLPEDTLSVVVVAEAGPGFTTIVGMVELTVNPLMVAFTVVAVPARTPVKVAV